MFMNGVMIGRIVTSVNDDWRSLLRELHLSSNGYEGFIPSSPDPTTDSASRADLATLHKPDAQPQRLLKRQHTTRPTTTNMHRSCALRTFAILSIQAQLTCR